MSNRYHHVTVLLFTWDTHFRDGSSSRYFIFINLFVHSVMYSYYAIQAYGIRCPSSFAMMITSIQMTQMLMGILVLMRVNSLMNSGQQCFDSTFTVVSGLLMYASYFILFAHFFVRRYFAKTPVKRIDTNNNSNNKIEGVREKLS